MGDYGFELEEETKSVKEHLIEQLKADSKTLNSQMRDVESKLNQSKGLVQQLTQRNATIVGEVQKIKGSLENTPRITIQSVFDDALSTQQRLMTARGELEKLQHQEEMLRGQLKMLESIIQALQTKDFDGTSSGDETFNAREIIVKVIDAQEEERERLARQMHDGPAHSLTNFILQAEISQKAFDQNPEKARAELLKLKDMARQAFQNVRTFIFDLRPMMLTDLGLSPTVRRYVDQFGEKSGIRVEFENIGGDVPRLENYREVLLFRGIQAVMVNGRDFGGATQIKVSLEHNGDRVWATIEDNGRGLGTGQLNLDTSKKETLGLSTLKERVQVVGGSLTKEATPSGTRMEINIPAGPPPDIDSDLDEFI